MIQVFVEWTPSHHPGDGRSAIESHLAAGLDEGPLLVVGCELRRRPKGRGDALIFADVNNYLSHLAMYDGELADERWVGLVRGASTADRPTALAALYQIKERIAPAEPRKLTIRLGSRTPLKQFDYAVLAGPHTTTDPFEMVSNGDGAREFALAFPTVTDILNVDQDDPV